MKLTDDSLRRLHREGTRRQARAGCPESEELGNLAAGTLDGGTHTRLLDHVGECADCAEELRLAQELRAGMADAVAAASSPRPAWRLVAAAAALLVVSVPLVLWWQDGGPDTTDRRSTAPAVTEAGYAPSHESILDEPPSHLEWPAISGARHRVELYDDESILIWRSEETQDPDAALPAEVRAAIESGRSYYWRVFTQRGIEESRSRLHGFEVAR